MDTLSKNYLTTSLPTMYSLELTPVCNNNCAGCLNEFSTLRKKNGDILTPLEWMQILKKAVLHAHRIRVTGGEPTLYYGFFEIVKFLRSSEKPFHIFTNARWKNAIQLVNTLKNTPNFTGLLVSLHGPNHDIHDKFTRISGSFEETIYNLRYAHKQGLKFNLCMVLKKYNYSLIPEMIELAKSFNAKLIVNRYYGLPEITEDISISELRSAVQVINHQQTLGQPVKFGNCIPQCFETSSSRGCSAGLNWCSIDSWGRVLPCDHAPDICGDLRTEDIEEDCD